MMLGCCVVDSKCKANVVILLPSPRTHVTIASKNNNLYTMRHIFGSNVTYQ